MNYFIYGLILLAIFFVLINYLRKLHWDAVHNNLFDLVDEFGGNVYRRGFLARPVYHGKYKNHEVTINFSQDRLNAKRKNYINISIDKKNKNSVTIVSLDWLKSQNESAENLKIVNLENSNQYGIRIENLNNTKEKELKAELKNLVPFNYVFFGQTGLIYEKESNNLGFETKPEKLKPSIESIYQLANIVK